MCYSSTSIKIRWWRRFAKKFKISKNFTGKVVYIDTEGTFRPEKIKEIAKRYGLEGDEVLENILVARCYTHEQQQNLLGEVVGAVSEEKFALLIIDSVTSLFRVDFSG